MRYCTNMWHICILGCITASKLTVCVFVFFFFISCSLLTLVWQRSTETTALDSTSPTEKTKTWLAQHAMPPSMHTWALNKGACTCFQKIFVVLKAAAHFLLLINWRLLLQLLTNSCKRLTKMYWLVMTAYNSFFVCWTF